MRFRKRDAGQKASAAPVIEDVPFFTQGPSPQDSAPVTGNSIEQLQKAERILGISHRQSSLVTPNNARQRGPQPAVSAQETTGNDLWSEHTEQELQPMDNARSANGGLKPWPRLQSKKSYGSHDAGGPSGGWAPPSHSKNTSHHNHISHEPSDSTLRSHYQASNQPLVVSQQTSASAVRDMGLRKVKSGANSSRNDVETAGRPLKSALKHPSHEPEHMEKYGGKKEGRRMPKFSNLFPGHAPSNRHLLQASHNGSSLSVNSTSTSNARSPSFSHNDSLVSPASESVSTDSTARPKIFESDVFDSSKVNVRRPPKGIQNWFDGVDISSDEEEQGLAEALPSTFSPYEDKPYRPAQQETRNVHSSAKQNAFPEYHAQPETRTRRSSRQPTQTTQPTRPIQTRQRNISDAFVEENAMAIDLARQRMQASRQKPQAPRNKRNSGDSFAQSSFSHAQSIMTGAHSGTSEYSSMKHDAESSRPAHSRLANGSILSFSDDEEDDRYRRSNNRQSLAASSQYTADVGQASPVSVQRPSVAPRPIASKRSNTRDTVMTTQTSGSIPIHWSDDAPLPTMPPLPRRATQESVVNHTSDALRRLIGREPSVRTRPSRPTSSRYESEGSIAGETIDSVPSDISRMMAVTEEEMALLEMMRLKRAAMAKGEISEGAQQILKREQEQILVKQKAAHKSAKKLLKAKEERQREHPDDWAYDLRPDYERITGLGSLREEDVDEKLRIERFLASETPLEEVFPFPISPDRSRDSSVPREPAPMEDLLLPRTYTPQPETRKKTPSPAPQAPKAPSTISGADESDHDESAQLAAEMRDFLGDNGFGSSSAFPMPPKSSSRRASRRVPRSNGMLAPALPSTREEEFTPPIPNRSPNRSPNRMPCFNDESVLPPSDRKNRLRADSDALQSFPPAINTQHPRPVRQPEPPTPSDASERLSAFLGPSFEANFDALEMTFPTSAGTSASHSSNVRYDSPSICTSQASPLTPTFPTPLATHDKNRGVEIAGNDMGYLNAYDRTDQNSARSGKSTSSRSQPHRQSKVPSPAPLEMLNPTTFNSGRTPSRMSSTGSGMSASDDVLAAWAELGGVSDGLPTRSRSPMRSR